MRAHTRGRSLRVRTSSSLTTRRMLLRFLMAPVSKWKPEMRRALLMGTLKAGANGGKYRQRVAAYIPRPRSRRISGVSMRRLPSGNNYAPKCALVAFLATSAAGISCKSVARWQIASDAIRAHATILLPSHFVRASASVSLETSWTVLSGLEDARLAMHIFLGTPRRRAGGGLQTFDKRVLGLRVSNVCCVLAA